MPRLNANPQAEATMAFDTVKPGDYRMRVESIEESESKATPGNICWRMRASYVDQGLEKLDGTGPAQNPGSIIDNGLVVYPPEKQGKVRGFVEACGLPWADIDSEQLIGREFAARVGIEEYQGEQRNVLKRYLPAAQ